MTRIDPKTVFSARGDGSRPADRPVVGMVHLLPLPGSPGYRGSVAEIEDRALSDASLLQDAGIDGLLVENFGDAPFLPGPVLPETVATLARVARSIVRQVSRPVGVNVLRNDAASALGIAVAVGAAFIRVNVHAGVMFTDQGILEGRAHETLRRRAALGADVAVLADVHVKHANPPPGRTLEDSAVDLWERSGADALIASGRGTGRPTDPETLRRIRGAVPEAPLWIGSGVTEESVAALLPLCDGLLVGSTLQFGGTAGSGVDPERARAFMDAARAARTRA